MNSEQYCEILEDGMEESFEKLEMKEEEHYFQQDNDPKHIKMSKTMVFRQQYLNIRVACTIPDLNPIEHLWHHLKSQLQQYDTPPKGVHELWERVVEEWNQISPEVCQNLIKSMPRQIQGVIKANGGHTKY